MRLRSVASLRGYRPIFVDGRELVVSRGAEIFAWRPGAEAEPRPLGRLEAPAWRRFAAHAPLARRVLRLDTDVAIRLDGGDLLVGSRAGVHRLARDGRVHRELATRPFRPFRFARWAGIPGFRDGVGFGDYGPNMARAPASIHLRDEAGRWRVAHTFGAGTVEHVHALVPDAAHGCVWILTGDYGTAAGIWRATDDFAHVEPILRGTQLARACVAFPIEGGLLYATDTHLEQNSICRLERDGAGWTPRRLGPMPGSCIYGGRVGDVMVFATAVEPGAPTGFAPFDLLDPRIGPGIARRACDLVATRDGATFHRLARAPTDLLPKRLFQFSALVIPEAASTDLLVTYGVGLRGREDRLEVSTIDREPHADDLGTAFAG